MGRLAFSIVTAALALPLVACGSCRGGGDEAPSRVELDPAANDGAVNADAGGEAARAQARAAARASLAAGTYAGPVLGAMNLQTSVMSVPAWPDDADAGVTRPDAPVRLGYMRHGARAPALSDAVVNDDCPEGWYELVEGGWVCGRGGTLDLTNPRVKLAPAPPDTKAPLPYRYGFSVADGTPLYRRVLSLADRRKFEPWLGGGGGGGAPAAADTSGGGGGEEAQEETTDSSSSDEEEEQKPVVRKAARHERKGRREEDTSWFTKAPEDGGKPRVRLEDLHGHGVLVRRMVRGFYLALDREFTAAHARWWRTTAGFAVPFERIMLQPPPSEYHGTWAKPEGKATTAAFVASESGAHKINVDADGKVTWGEALPRRAAVLLTGKTITQNGMSLAECADGSYVQLAGFKEAKPSAPPSDLLPNEKWIDVDLTRQALVAFEGNTAVFATLISSGRRNLADKEHDYPTPTGMFRIREKHVTATMDGNVASDGPYSIEDVPWVMYFQGSYALHGAFWHNAFGTNRSHGCVNMSPTDARTLFEWTEPHLPQGWHGVFPTDDHPGTRVIIHEDPSRH